MPNLIRSMANRLNSTATLFSNSSPRRSAQLPVQISLADSLQTQPANCSDFLVEGRTKELSQNSVSFIVPVIRLKENYLAGHEEKLMIEIAAPNSRIQMLVTAKRYEQIEHSPGVGEYLITARIEKISTGDAESYADLLKNNDRSEKANQKTLRQTEKPTLANQFFNLF